MIGQDSSVDQPAVARPRLGCRHLRSAHEDVVDALTGAREAPLGRGQVLHRGRMVRGHVEVSCQHADVTRLGKGIGEYGGTQKLGVRKPFVRAVARCVQVCEQSCPSIRKNRAHGLTDPAFLRPRPAGYRRKVEPLGLSPPKRSRVERQAASSNDTRPLPQEQGISLSREGRPQASRVQRRERSSERGCGGERPECRMGRHFRHGGHSAPTAQLAERPGRHFLEEDGGRPVRDGEPHHLLEKRPALGRIRVTVEHVPAAQEQFQGGTSVRAVRVILADPAAFTPQYDHELAAALSIAGADVRLLTSRFRFGVAPAPAGYRREEVFYPLTTRLFRRSRARLPLKAAEHCLGLARLRHERADVVHVQWLAAPEIDDRLLRLTPPAVFTAHDLLPRRTAEKHALWRRLLGRFARIVVHSERGRHALAEIGVPEAQLRVIAHPAFRSDPVRRDDGRTLLCLGVIRPYKGLADAIEAVRQVAGARLLVAGDPAEPVDRYRQAAGPLAEWRLGYLSDAELDRALGETTVGLFPYRGEIDQSGALLRVLGAGVPAIVYDVGGLPDPVRAFGAGRVVPPGDVGALAGAVTDLLENPDALAEARDGARRAADSLTWEKAASDHLEVYREVTA